MMMTHFAANEVEVFVISNSEAADAPEMRARLAALPNVTHTFLPLGKPSDALAAKGKLGKAVAYGPSAASLARVIAYVRKHRIQVIHATDRPRDASYTSLLGYLTNAVSVVHMHAPVGDLSRPTLWGLRHAKAVFAVSSSIRADLIAELGLDANKVHTIHNSVDTDFFDPERKLPESVTLRERFGIPRDARIAGIAARMNPWKGQLELIGATGLLRAQFPDLHIVILGSDVPEIRAQLEQRAREAGISDRVHFGGFQKDVRPFLHEIDLFVHPSYREPFGLSIAEAMAMRKPVVACGTGGVPEIITHGADGLLVEERSAEAVASAMQTLLNDPELCRRLGNRGRETVRERFSPRRQCAAAAEQYASLVAAA
jgi:glycosyltransferase involved in cell wall biosynthesis